MNLKFRPDSQCASSSVGVVETHSGGPAVVLLKAHIAQRLRLLDGGSMIRGCYFESEATRLLDAAVA